ncbi:MAG: hypothetical protein IGS38_02715 [Synechococcales cyanobacterium M58_A2018_015]|nr:hypothetical protein [Synechococcales cyanobacterium M58_A2018_015]
MEPLTVLIAIASLVFLGYAFSQIFSQTKPANPTVRFLTISLMVLVGLLLANRLLAPSLAPGVRGSSDLLPREFPNFGRLRAPAQEGWRFVPDAILRSLLSDAIDNNSANNSPEGSPPASPLPSPTPGVVPSPLPEAEPVLPTPVPSPLPTPPVSPPISPLPPPSPEPSPSPLPPPSPEPSPLPSLPPSLAPRPPQPVPAWW